MPCATLPVRSVGQHIMMSIACMAPAGVGTVGNLQSPHFSHGEEFQVLAMFQSKQWAVDELLQHLDGLLKKTKGSR